MIMVIILYIIVILVCLSFVIEGFKGKGTSFSAGFGWLVVVIINFTGLIKYIIQ